jgi:predicted metal-dependent hydrolase
MSRACSLAHGWQARVMMTMSLVREPITVRRMDFEFGTDIPELWADGNPMLTALMAGLSASFPPGERYFIESVRHYADQVTDPGLKERIRGFIGQEANHTKEHLAFNAFLDGRGLPILAMQRLVERTLKTIEKSNSPAANLARTVALEHLTAFLASAFLENPELLDRVHPTVAAFWAWHAIEEIEHRSVAFDVYKELVDDEWLRIRTMAITTFVFSLVTAIRTLVIMRSTGNLFNVRSMVDGIATMFGREGMFRHAMPLYRAYYRRDFHPDQHDNLSIVQLAKRKYLGAKA